MAWREDGKELSLTAPGFDPQEFGLFCHDADEHGRSVDFPSLFKEGAS
jgi:hypothetical protein